MNSTELIVALKIPDNIALTALKALHNLEFSKVNELKRADYYSFESSSDYREKLSRCDILVNANKHSVSFSLEDKYDINNDDNYVNILVTSRGDDGDDLLHILNERLGFTIKRVKRGTLWTFVFDKSVQFPKQEAVKAVEKLLCNQHYQEYEFK